MYFNLKEKQKTVFDDSFSFKSGYLETLKTGMLFCSNEFVTIKKKRSELNDLLGEISLKM